MRDRSVAVLALAHVVRGVCRPRDEVVVDRPALAALDVDAVLADVPHGEVRRSETIGVFPAEPVHGEVVRRQVQDRDAVGTDDDACPAYVLAVENDRVSVDASDRDAVLVVRHDVAALIGAAVDDDRVARIGARDRRANRQDVLRDANRRLRVAARKAERRERDSSQARDAQGAYALASSSSFFVSEITFCAMCAGTSS
jgi:hypothetical protein